MIGRYDDCFDACFSWMRKDILDTLFVLSRGVRDEDELARRLQIEFKNDTLKRCSNLM